ncbi:Claudin protein septate junction protein [Fasciola hepatica]|uniref:Claudin protein septate junction protein n=1 Tax=Fasciola hepatica TaxID=6192 RepID=A0A4E0RYZ2_FASHE|nr:Claudin protein septate junction protein [Fasciola hepatica]
MYSSPKPFFPPFSVWFYAIQVLSSCGMLVHSLVLFVVLCQTTNSIKRDNLQVAKFNLAGHFFVCLTLAASLVAFAIARYDSTWMPFPQFNVLSWSYSVAVLSFALTLISFLVGFVRYMYLDAVLDEYQVALLRHQADMDVSSPPMKERPAPLGYEPRQLSTTGVQDARYINPHSYVTGRTRDQDDEDVLDEEAANEDFDELNSEQMQDRDSNFNGLDPRLSGGSVYSDEQRPMIHHARS